MQNKKTHLFNTVSILLLLTLATPAQCVQKVTYVDATELRSNPNNQYFGKVLALALAKSEPKYGPFELMPIDIEISQNRQLREINEGTVDIFWSMTNYRREAELLPIRFPLTKGMYGVRMLAINKKDKESFAKINTVSELAKYTALSGGDWPDTAILRVNRLNVKSQLSEPTFYQYLAQNPGFYFPRAITEIFAELAERTELNIESEQHLAIIYPTAMYFFVSKDNPLLAERIEYGLNQASADGSFDTLFYQFEYHQQAFKKANLGSRTIIYLDNPLLPISADKEEIKKLQRSVIQRFSLN